MYSEQQPVKFEGGIHNGTCDALSHLGEHGLTLNGLNPADLNNWDTLMTQHKDPNSQVSIEVNHPDEQTARDIATIARHTIWNGRNLWPGRQIPPERFNQGANHLRGSEGLPEETPMQIQASADVSSDMSVLSKWNVVALGELQQPGGVGATQDYNPVVDGPNPDGPNFDDNAGNSPEQEVALQTWINLAVDLMNRGSSPEEITAQLAHDGCPNPEEVVQRAQQQPTHSPVDDNSLSDPLEVPNSPDPTSNGQMESLSQQPPVQASVNAEGHPKTCNCPQCQDAREKAKAGAGWDDTNSSGMNEPAASSLDRKGKVRIAGTTMTGTEIERWEDMWGQGSVRIALDGGGTLDVSPDAVQPAEGVGAKHPVTEIQSFIDSMPEVKPTRPHIEARLANLELVRRAVRSNISKVGFSDQVKLQRFDTVAEEETAALREILGNLAEDFEAAYVKSQPRFAFNKFEIAAPEIVGYAGHSKEAGAIWAIENFDGAIDDDNSFRSAAAHYASRLGLTGEQFQQFMSGADEHRKVRTEEFTATEPETIENEGPAEALFV